MQASKPERNAAVVRDYIKGRKIREIAKDHRISSSMVDQIIRRSGVVRRYNSGVGRIGEKQIRKRRYWTPEEDAKLMMAMRSGSSFSQAATLLKTHPASSCAYRFYKISSEMNP